MRKLYIQGTDTQKRHFVYSCKVNIIRLVKFSYFLLANERRFQRTKDCDIWIPFAKVMKGQFFLIDALKSFIQHMCTLILEMYTSDDGCFRQGAIWVVSTIEEE